MIISLNSGDTSMPSVMAAITFLMHSLTAQDQGCCAHNLMVNFK